MTVKKSSTSEKISCLQKDFLNFKMNKKKKKERGNWEKKN